VAKRQVYGSRLERLRAWLACPMAHCPPLFLAFVLQKYAK